MCVTLVRLIARALPRAREFVANRVLPPLLRAKRACIHATNSHQMPQHRISGLDGPLCMGQPWSPNVITKSGLRKTSGETGLLPARLVVASFGAIIVGCFAAAATPDGHKEPAEVPPNASTHSDGESLPPMAPNEPQGIEEPAPYQLSGFSVLAAPATERLSPPGMTVAEIMGINRPSTEILERPDELSEPIEVTVPVRKPTPRLRLSPNQVRRSRSTN
jgi:hypothetical protein